VVTSWWSIAEPADNTAFELDILWTFFFSMPMFLISKILSNFFFQDIADAGYSHTREGHRTRKKDGGAFRDLADMVYDSVLLLMLGIQVSVRVHRVPGSCHHIHPFKRWQGSMRLWDSVPVCFRV
jgi:hypothetical protein